MCNSAPPNPALVVDVAHQLKPGLLQMIGLILDEQKRVVCQLQYLNNRVMEFALRRFQDTGERGILDTRSATVTKPPMPSEVALIVNL